MDVILRIGGNIHLCYLFNNVGKNGIKSEKSYTYLESEAHTDSDKEHAKKSAMKVEIEFNSTSDDKEAWETIHQILLNQYMERLSLGSLQKETEALYSQSNLSKEDTEDEKS